jgi:hypothetical protein
MLGWWITIKSLPPEEADKLLSKEASAPYMLANWEVGVSGLRWLNELVDAGKAQQLKNGSYPNRYVCKAADVLPVIETPKEWMKNLVHRPENIAKCTPETVLTVDAWDLS